MLVSAVEHGDFESVQALVITEDLDETNSQGFTALCIAAQRGFTEIAEVLLQAGAKIDLRNHVKFTQ